MDESGVQTVVLTSVALVLAALTGIAMCLCCYCWVNKEKDTYKKVDDDGYYALAPTETTTDKTDGKSSFKLKVKGQAKRLGKVHSVQQTLCSQPGLSQPPGATNTQSEVADSVTSEATQQASIMAAAAMESAAAAPGQGSKLGSIEFILQYDEMNTTLGLKILRAENLPIKDMSGTSDPYVKILLLPDKKTKMTTKIKRKNLNPTWNETFLFEGFPYSKLMDRTLYMQVLDYDRFSRDDSMGELYLPLASVDLTQKSIWMDLEPCKGHKGKLGELLLSLCYEPTLGRLTVVIMKARELKSKDINGYSDPYVKIWLLKQGKKMLKLKTTVKEKNLNPVYNETLVFNVSYTEIRQTSLRVSVMDYDTLGRNEKIGEVLLGSQSGPQEKQHWSDMFTKARQHVAQWHMLKEMK